MFANPALESNIMPNALVDFDGVGLDDGLDAKDVAMAMKQRAIEEHVSSGKVRAAYYNAYCYLRDLEEAGRDLKNERLLTLAMDMLNSLDHYHDELEDKYQWD